MRHLLPSILLLSVLAACGGESTPPDDLPVADLDITVEHPDRDTITYRISCRAESAATTGGEAGIDATAACSALADPEAFTRLVDGPPRDQVCTEQYGGPDTATIVGTLDGQSVDTTIDRANGCGIYDWDELLDGVLPEALGVTG